MLKVHHLNQSRSQRILWALEELGLPYQLIHYQREKTMLAPESLKKVHPLGKSPVLEDDGLILAESGAILEYLQETYDTNSLLKPQDREMCQQYRFWLHYAEGSLMPLLLMKLVFASLGKPPVPFGVRTIGKMLGQGIQKAWLNKQIETHARYIESQLAVKPWFAGEQLSMADIQMSFPIFALLSRGGIADLPHTQSWKKRVEMRPAWQRAIEQGGPLDLPGT
ncbi:glutathione S-transferase [Phytobacter diazotrophicus]|uniref:glutathione S-transferase family protein n=1 Tax=Phytobacter diazotrophicus TaxID=395631 RepID=UPI0013ED9C1B|nr:glutathione S-transferase [Phytobacter diazotrophicus]MDU7131523.1 glutathione S-transferase [Enterobacteriaceae bacterium]QIH65638.1 glutathione S-transferase [Enterobacteriaceae bacterium A-F18]MDU4353201.1 glutathione S-transferase [Phytobacter diazotrophicus]MDU7196872.1 glutathione S-transferase [Enterobacteriaceae bacterium]MDV2874305.1 glutathione S-transferase [Phytobacter diazotrophicus]